VPLGAGDEGLSELLLGDGVAESAEAGARPAARGSSRAAAPAREMARSRREVMDKRYPAEVALRCTLVTQP
jgi:hypothetical protein